MFNGISPKTLRRSDLSIEESVMNKVKDESLRLSHLMKKRVEDKYNGELIFSMIAGSHCYGLSTPSSDVDVRCIHVVDTDRVLGLRGLSNSASTEQMSVQEGDDCDVVSQEVGKFCRLALDCNPNILEMLFVPMDNVVVLTRYYELLREMRGVFLCTNMAENAYLGYARSQLERLLRKQGNQDLQSELKKLNIKQATDRMVKEASRLGLDTLEYDVKHAMHLVRLVMDLEHLLMTGELLVDMTSKKYILMPIREGRAPLISVISSLNEMMVSIDEIIESGKSVLPESPKEGVVDSFLVSVRRDHL